MRTSWYFRLLRQHAVDRGHRVTVADSHEPILPTYHWLKVLQDQWQQWQLKQVDVTPQLWKQHLTRQVTSQTVSELFVFTDIWMAILLKCKDPSCMAINLVRWEFCLYTFGPVRMFRKVVCGGLGGCMTESRVNILSQTCKWHFFTLLNHSYPCN